MPRRTVIRARRPSPRVGECEGFALLAGSADASPAQALRLARRVVREVLGSGWRVVALGQTQQVHVLKRPGRRLGRGRPGIASALSALTETCATPSP